MANEAHLARLKEGVTAWNRWRVANRNIKPDLAEADLSGAKLSVANLAKVDLFHADLSQADLFHANLSRANLSIANLAEANLCYAKLSQVNLSHARLSAANLSRANLSKANLSEADLAFVNLSVADLSQASLFRANLFGANLSWAKLRHVDLKEGLLNAAVLVETNFERADLTGCSVYGSSTWNTNLVGAQQSDLVITSPGEPIITVDNLEVAQFIYLLLHNKNIRHVIETVTSKAVLILGRFTPERKAVLDAIRKELRRRNYLPILFDFEKPASRNLTETISTLAHLARFIIADLTEAKSLPQELQRIIPDLPSVPVQPLLHASASEYGMFEHFKQYPWVLETYRYESLEEVIASLPEKVIAPAEVKAKELLGPMRR
jgi:uncharacterized protein YjbI with pentapeptide repeats